MPVMNGRRVSLAEWRAANAPAPDAIEAADAEDAPIEEKPKRQRRASKKDVASQVQAALGIQPVEDGDIVSAVASAGMSAADIINAEVVDETGEADEVAS